MSSLAHPMKIGAVILFGAVSLSLSLPSKLAAQAGDLKDSANVIQTEVWKEMDTPPAPILTPEEAMASFHIERGFRLELVAAEPLVNDPVAIAWDEAGRLWVCEFWAYMPNADGDGEDEPVGRVVVLEDIDQDGRMDRSTVFLDGLVLPRAIAIVEGGVLIGNPPELLFCQDLDGDLKCDQKTVIAKYGVTGNVEHAENGLMHGMDNWLYNAKSDRRMRFENGSTFTEEPTHSRGQWGISMDNFGRIFYNNNSVMLLADTRPWEIMNGHPGWQPTAGFDENVVKDNSISSIRVNPGINRGYQPNKLRPDNRIKSADAASAPSIYRGDRYPNSYHNNAFVPEPAGNLVARYSLSDSKLTVETKHEYNNHPKWGPVDFIASTDERFRPVATKTGPDGFLYIVDMYRGILQHKTYLTSFLKKQIIERKLDEPVGLGRIYRVVHESDTNDRKTTDLTDLSDSDLVEFLSNPNGWYRDTAQRLLVQRNAISDAALEKLVTLATSGNEIERIHSLWTLQGISKADTDLLLRSMQEATPWTKSHAWRIAFVESEKIEKTEALLNQLRSDLQSKSDQVRLDAFSVARKFLTKNELVTFIGQGSHADFESDYFQDAFLSSLATAEVEFLSQIKALGKAKSNKLSPFVAKLAEATYRAYPNFDLANLTSGNASEVFRETFAFAKTEAESADKIAYTANELLSIERGKALYESVCAACHQTNGLGLQNLAPPLAGSEWVTGSKKRLIVSVYQGLEGPITVKGTEWNLSMPAHGQHLLLQGQSMSDLLSYIRSAWNNNSETISEWNVHEAINPFQDRQVPWTMESLLEWEL